MKVTMNRIPTLTTAASVYPITSNCCRRASGCSKPAEHWSYYKSSRCATQQWIHHYMYSTCPSKRQSSEQKHNCTATSE